MARFLGVGGVFKSPRTTRTYVVSPAPQWQDLTPSPRPPAHIIGVGGFGATYRVVDDRGETFAMKEYFPRDHATRGTDGRITPRRSEDGFSKKIYEEGLRRFVAEGHLLTSFSHPSVLRVVDAFDDNGTSYQLMRLVEGREQLGESDTGAARIERRVTFEDFLRELEATGVPIELPLIRSVIRQLLDAVEYIHTEGSRKAAEITGATTRVLLHRDIKPSNILIEAPDGLRDEPADEILRHADTKAILIDFGSARIFRDVQTDDVSRSIGVVTEGYAPPELKDNDIDQQGPHSDIYSIAAVIWRALTGRKPTTAQLANGAKLADLAQPIVGPDGKSRPRAARPFLEAVDQALNAAVGQRPQSVAAWRTQLSGQSPGQTRKPPPRKTSAAGARSGSPWGWILGLAAVAAVVAWGIWYAGGGPGRAIESEGQAAAHDAENAVKIAEDAAGKADKAAADGGALMSQAEAKATEARARFERLSTPQTGTVAHDANSGEERMGDKSVTFTRTDGSKLVMWCFKRGPGVDSALPYVLYTYGDVKVDGEPGWTCGAPHTHQVTTKSTEPKNPWHVVGEGFVYDGEVDAQGRPQGLGAMTIKADTYEGRWTQDGTNYWLLGGVPSKDANLGGRVHVVMSNPPNTDAGLAALKGGDKLTVRQDIAPEQRSVGVLSLDQTTKTGFSWKGAFMGSTHLPDGTTAFTTASKQSWGRIDRSDGTYLGQITDNKPDGCGGWRWRNGSKEFGFYVAGARQGGDLPEACKNPHYQRPVDIDAVARSGASALPL